MLILSIDIFSLLTLNFANIDWQASYLLFSLLIAMLIIYESIMLFRHNEQLPTNSIAQLVTLLDLIWLILSGIALYAINFHPVAKIVPILFIIYNLFGWFYGAYVLKDQINEQTIEEIVIPKRFIDYSMSFGIGVMVAIIGVLYHLHQQQRLVISTFF